MAFTPESTQGMEAGVAPLFMQQGYDAEQAKKAAMLKSLQGFGVPGSQITGLTPQQAQMNEVQKRANIAEQARLASPAYQKQIKSEAAATDQANFEARRQAYMAKQLQEKLQQQKQQEQQPSSGIFPSWFK